MIAPEQFNLAEYCLDARLSEGLGDKVALVTDERDWTYAQVQARAHQAAQVLRDCGVEPEQRVMVALPDSIEFVAAMFGILKLGAVLVMANPGLDQEGLQDLVDFTRSVVVLGPEGVKARKGCLTQKEFGSRMDAAPTSWENFPTHRDDLAIWLFSGGTTGRPKAVPQSHQSFFNTTELYAKGCMEYRSEDRTMSVPKLFFGYATGSNLIFTFSVGGTTVLFPEKPTPEVLFERIARHRPTILINVPTMVNRMLSHDQAAAQDLSSIRFSTSAGEALPEALYHHWKETFGVELYDGLGTAEMWHIFLTNQPGKVKPGTLGQAVEGFDIKVADDDGREVNDGEVGRLWVAGDSRALCYWQLPEKSHEAFRGRYFAAGDLVMKDEDGFFHYCGRGDEMLKVAGRWLAPQEVEGCLLEHQAVKEAAVVGVVGEDGLTRPHAYVVPTREGSTELAETLKQYVLSKLEPYKHPRQIHFLAEFPRTHLGKVDRGALRRAPVQT